MEGGGEDGENKRGNLLLGQFLLELLDGFFGSDSLFVPRENSCNFIAASCYNVSVWH